MKAKIFIVSIFLLFLIGLASSQSQCCDCVVISGNCSSSIETNCSDNIDNDQDGLTDCEDDDCIGIGDCPPWHCEECPTYPECYGWCPPDMVCTVVMEEDYTYCECQLEEEPTTTIPEETTTVPPAIEFATGSLAAAILLVTPAFAYLLVRKRH